MDSSTHFNEDDSMKPLFGRAIIIWLSVLCAVPAVAGNPYAGGGADQAKRRPINMAHGFDCTKATGETVYIVPSNKRFVIETASVKLLSNDTGPLLAANPSAEIITNFGPDLQHQNYQIPLTGAVSGGLWAGTKSWRVYAEPGTQVGGSVAGTGSSLSNCLVEFSVSGYLIPADDQDLSP
jgi:hypothetical protein